MRYSTSGCTSVSPEGAILIDSGSFHHRQRLSDWISDATAWRGIGAIILFHSDYPHSGNIPTFRRNGATSRSSHLAATPPPGTPIRPPPRIGDVTEVLGQRFHVLDPPLADRNHTMWVYDEVSRTLSVADGFGTLHAPGACDIDWGRIAEGGRAEGVHVHAQTLPSLRYADPARVMGALHAMLERYPPAWIAPIHGPPIAEADVECYMTYLGEALTRIAPSFPRFLPRWRRAS
ncbi:hypothetical protein [Candidatus Palauibacter sp.]|uniref:hypothetical protein n=1 Tax=Candidatus Palauibacter sp. TaxID=3101350 RepID=UPI003C705B59